MSFQFSESNLKRLCDLNFFPMATTGMILFGLRGCLPTNTDDASFAQDRGLETRDVNYTNPRCTLGQWQPEKGTIAVFPGSTVPHRSHMKTALSKDGKGANQIATGFYSDYRKGVHKPGGKTAHDAFRQTQARPIRRTADDFDYENDDRVEYDNPFDNLHAAWCQGTNAVNYASAGCQVVVGFPKCPKPGFTKDVGPWRDFKANAYKIAQTSFPYVLLDGKDAERVASTSDPLSVRLRFGSKGDLVTKLQEELKKLGFYEGEIDDDFGERTHRAVTSYQTVRFGPLEDDGIVGPVTASALGIKWPEL